MLFRHRLRHAPQFSRSTLVSTQRPSHKDKPGLQAIPHCPSRQVATELGPARQTLPQPPQFSGSSLTSMQPAPQAMYGELQAKSQLPATQVGLALAGGMQILPQAPQFEVLLFKSTHEPSQFLVVPPQVTAH